MKTYVQKTCEELYWETARNAVTECKLVVGETLKLCRSIFRMEEEKALENRYGHLFASYGEGNVGEKLLDRMVAISLPAYGNNLDAIEEMLDDPYHAELNAYYYFMRGRVLVEDYVFPTFDWATYHALREWDFGKAREMWEDYEEKKRSFFMSIAEELWDFWGFAERYQAWLTFEQIDAYCQYCKKLFIEERIFLQPEWLLFACEEWDGKESFLMENPCTDFFLQAHQDSLSLLPSEALNCKVFKGFLAKKYKIKRF